MWRRLSNDKDDFDSLIELADDGKFSQQTPTSQPSTLDSQKTQIDDSEAFHRKYRKWFREQSWDEWKGPAPAASNIQQESSGSSDDKNPNEKQTTECLLVIRSLVEEVTAMTAKVSDMEKMIKQAINVAEKKFETKFERLDKRLEKMESVLVSTPAKMEEMCRGFKMEFGKINGKAVEEIDGKLISMKASVTKGQKEILKNQKEFHNQVNLKIAEHLEDKPILDEIRSLETSIKRLLYDITREIQNLTISPQQPIRQPEQEENFIKPNNFFQIKPQSASFVPKLYEKSPAVSANLYMQKFSVTSASVQYKQPQKRTTPFFPPPNATPKRFYRNNY